MGSIGWRARLPVKVTSHWLLEPATAATETFPAPNVPRDSSAD